MLIPYIVKKTSLSFKAGAPIGEIEKSGVAFARLFNQWFDRDVSKLPTAN